MQYAPTCLSLLNENRYGRIFEITHIDSDSRNLLHLEYCQSKAQIIITSTTDVAYEPWVTMRIDLLSSYLHLQTEKETK